MPERIPRLAILAAAVIKARETVRASLKRRLIHEMLAKAPHDYQTDIDVDVEELVNAFLSYAIRGEEAVGNREAEPGTPVIYIDPIDGTTNFAWEIPHFGMTISIVQSGKLVAGVVLRCNA